MKTPLNILLVAAALIIHAHAVAPGNAPLLQSRDAKVNAIATATKQLADFDAKYAAILGEGWVEALKASQLSEGEVMADAYISGQVFDYNWETCTPAVKSKLVSFLRTKPTLTAADLTTIRHGITTPSDNLQTRMDDILALMPGLKTYGYYQTKYRDVLGGNRNESVWNLDVTLADWLDFSTGEYDAAKYAMIRNNVLLLVTKALVDHRKAANEDTDGPAFDAELAPVITALGAPLFDGLPAATAPLGLTIVMPDYTETTTRINRLAASIERRTATPGEAAKSIGTIMFVKGVTAYNEWKAANQ